MKTLLHVNYLEIPGRLDKTFALANRFGYDGVELRGKYVREGFDLKAYREEISALKSTYPEMEIVFGQMIPVCRGTEEAVKEGMDFLQDLMEWSGKACGTKLFNFFTGPVSVPGVSCSKETTGSGIALESDYEKSAAALRILGEKAASLGQLISLEMHNGYIHDLAAPTKKLLDMVDHDAVGANYDHGNVVLNKNGESIAKVFEILQDKIYYAHLKNVHNIVGTDGGYTITHLSHGCINQYEVMEGLKKYLRSGIIALEYPSQGDGVYAAKVDMEYVKFLKDELSID